MCPKDTERMAEFNMTIVKEIWHTWKFIFEPRHEIICLQPGKIQTGK